VADFAGLFRDLAFAGFLAAAVLVLFRRLGIPAIVGYLVAGLLAGPHGFHLVDDVDRVETLAKIGVVLLLFTIGLELPSSRIGALGRDLLGGGSLQLGLTFGATVGIASLSGLDLRFSLFLGGFVSLSSTAIVLRARQERGELHSPHGRFDLGILLFQDLAIVPMMMVLPLLSEGDRPGGKVGGRFLVAAAVVAGVFVVSRRVVPRLLSLVADTKSRELFVIVVAAVGLGTAALTEWAGIGLALGAFLAGLVIADSEWRHQALADMLPMRDSLAFLFFVSAGMLVDPHLILSRPGLLLGGSVAILAGKGVIVFVVARLLGHAPRTAILSAFALGQVGEFSFVLSRTALDLGVVDPATDRALLAIAATTMLLSPLLLACGPAVAARWPEVARSAPPPGADRLPKEGHVVIAGYGVGGQNLARVLSVAGIPHLVVEISGESFRRAVEAGEPALFGDVTRATLLEHAGIHDARALVLTIDDPEAARRAVRIARGLAPELFLLVRTRRVSEIEELEALGASEVVPEEFETSIEVFSRVLRHFHLPGNVLRLQADLLRRERYGMLRGVPSSMGATPDLAAYLQKTATESLAILEGSPAIGRSLRQLDFRRQTEGNVVAFLRSGRHTDHPDPDLPLEVGDVLLVTGSHAALDRVETFLAPK
jgi:CPA2 family monovalent cation:H+ antiporter-2